MISLHCPHVIWSCHYRICMNAIMLFVISVHLPLFNFFRNSAKVFQFRVVICAVPFARSYTLHSSLWCS
ncbi:hypothetical protein EJB05_00723 [Eragrostis curvula]|uniref:Uncharacterized protein n=1 Tax=Eragrostis curvula TaxID=38414 RepID=A0A5J9WQ50_9POAL|nr:hypothetical protein EJB05_00723 [Eragrostis curvula]